MGYGEIDQKAINTIRTLAVSFSLFPSSSCALDFTPPRLPRHSFTLGLGGRAEKCGERDSVTTIARGRHRLIGFCCFAGSRIVIVFGLCPAVP
jgi:hypothetical protein